MKVKRTATFCLLVQLTFRLLTANGTDRKKVAHWAKLIGESAKTFSDEITASKHIKKAYEDLGLKIQKVDGESLTIDLANELERFFDEKVKTLRKLAEEASRIEDEYRENYQHHDWFNGKALQGMKLVQHANFDVPVNLTDSIVHVPTEVYDQDSKVVRDIQWTKALNKIFQNNFEQYSGLSWQYFGTVEGVHRQFPGREWPLPSNGFPDLYDARRRPWYIQGANSPKNVIILIDRSGSLLGSRIEIASYAARILVETLTTNDFFHVITFNEESDLICCHTNEQNKLLQATRGNKEYVKALLKQIKAEGTTDWERAIKMALQMLKKTQEDMEGSLCQQTLFILSDGSATYPKELFEKYDPHGLVHVFAYVIGPKQYEVTQMQEMACKHKGVFLRISSIGAVWDIVTSSTRILSRPIGRSADKPTTFTSAFVDATGGGLVSTGSTPVFKKSNSELLGVMATDVPVKDLHEFIYYPLTGQNSYVFVIDNNGLVLIHPAINGKKLARLNPQPNMAIEELEFAVHNHSHVKQLHREMILMNPGTPKQLKFDVYIKSKDELRVRRIAATYHFFRSTKSPFSTGIASPKFGFFVQSPNITLKEGLKYLKNVSDIMHWPFCPKLRRLKDTKTVMVQRIAENENKTHLDTCNHRMVHGLLLDAKATSQLPKQWKSKREKIEENGINHIFIRTHWGVIQSIKRKNNSELIDGGFESISRESYDPFDFYKRANHIPNRLTISLIKGRGEDDHVISIHNPILQKKAGITLAVTGVEMSYEKFMTTNFIEKTKEFPDEHLYDGRLTCDRHLKNQVEGLYCYLLDENGFVVASNEEADIGLFFGEVDQNVMRKLIEEDKSHSLYQVVTLPDYQASCKLPTNNDSSAAELKNIFTWIISLLVSLLQTSLF
eukprot:TCONS_00063925-protein